MEIHRLNLLVALLSLLDPWLTCTLVHGLDDADISYTVAVFGSTPAGITAALAASQQLRLFTGMCSKNMTENCSTSEQGGKVVLISPGKWIGGMMSGGLGCTDSVGSKSYGGLARSLLKQMTSRYTHRKQIHCNPETAFEPHVATDVFRRELAAANVTVVLNAGDIQEVMTSSGSPKSITSIRTTTGGTFSATVFVDASYEGDLVAAADVSFTIGREGADQYGEPHAGRMPLNPGACYGFKEAVDPYTTTGNHTLPIVYNGSVAPVGGGDNKVMAYNYRLCLTNASDPALRVEITKPQDYDPAYFEMPRRYMTVLKPKSLDELLKLYTIANSSDGYKLDVNAADTPFSTDLAGASWTYCNGLLWFLRTDASLPPNVRAAMATWGWCRDEFTDNNYFPTQLYVRAGRRMVGAAVVTEVNATSGASHGNATVAVAEYAFDVHPVEIVPHGNRAIVEGCIGGAPPAWEIPYAAITPKSSESSNLLVPVALSASHVAYSSIRLEITWMVLGESAGIAAAVAAQRDVAVQQVPLNELHAILLARGQVLKAL